MPASSAGLLAGLPPVSSAAFAHMARLAGPMGGHHDFIKKEEDMHKALGVASALDERHVSQCRSDKNSPFSNPFTGSK
jgi:hypothetical protein